ncbi:hypothetical protein EMCRGX_G014860 [Ephydatia muelleri]
MAALRYYSNLEDAKTAYPFSEFQRRLCQDKGVKVGVKKEHYDTFIEALQGRRFQQVISRSKVKHLLEFPSLIKTHDIHDKAQDMATIILQEEAATRAMIEKDQEQPQSSRGGRPPKNAKGGGRKPLAQLIGQASNALHVRQSTVRPTGKENKTKRAIKKKKKGVKVRSQKLQRTNYSQEHIGGPDEYPDPSSPVVSCVFNSSAHLTASVNRTWASPFNLATSIITKSILSQFIKAQKLNKQEWKSYVTRKQLDSKLGISSKGVTSSMLVTFLKDILEEQPGCQWLAKTTPTPLETVEAPI